MGIKVEKSDSYISKIAYSKDNKKLGKIIAVEGSAKKLIALKKPHAVIDVRRIFKDDIRISLPLKKIIREEKNKIWFDITKQEFNLEIKAIDHEKQSEKTSKAKAFQKRLGKGFDRGYYHKKEKGEW